MATTVYSSTKAEKSSTPKGRLFLTLYIVGMLGVLTLLQAPFSLPEGVETPLSPGMLRLLGLVQSAVLVAVAVAVGLFTAPKVGLRAPVTEAFVTGQRVWPVLQRQLWPAFLGALLGMVVIAIYGLLQPLLMPEVLAATTETELPLLMRVLYGGITEELLLRWGMMSFLVWFLWRIFQRGGGAPRDGIVWTGNLLSAILFGVGHLPAITLFGIALTAPMVAAVILGNAAAGIIFGWLYWRRGLEAAMIAHAGTHVLTVGVLAPLVGPLING